MHKEKTNNKNNYYQKGERSEGLKNKLHKVEADIKKHDIPNNTISSENMYKDLMEKPQFECQKVLMSQKTNNPVLVDNLFKIFLNEIKLLDLAD